MSSIFDTPVASSSYDQGSSSSEGGLDPQVASFIQTEQQRALIQAQIHKMTNLCWEQCMGYPREKLDNKTESCMSNCVDRFFDTTLFIANRFQTMVNK